MKKFFCVFLMVIMSGGLFAQASDEQIRQAANTLGVPYEALKQFVESYKPQTTPAGTISIDAVKLYQEYDANEVKADSQYKGKSLRVTGPVLDIKKELGRYFVVLPGDGLVDNISVYFEASEVNKLGNLSKGQRITIIGTCNGKDMFDDIIIRNSIIQN